MAMTFQDVLQRLNADRINETGEGVIVAILDSGVSEAHPLINGKILGHYDMTGDGPGDVYGHGTAVCSCIANIAPNIKIIDIKVIKDDGKGDFSQAMQGAELALQLGAHIVNMSFAGGQDCMEDSTFARFLDELASKGLMLIAACGNEGPDQSPRLPALARGVVAIGAIDENDEVPYFSSRGPSCSRIYPDCASYGADLQVATIDGGSQYGSGTSFSCPNAVGVLSCVLEKTKSTLLREQTEDLLQKACIKNYSEKNNESGWGKLDAKLAVDNAEPAQIPPVKPSKGKLIAGGLLLAGLGAAAYFYKKR